jgi:hypothetical protein
MIDVNNRDIDINPVLVNTFEFIVIGIILDMCSLSFLCWIRNGIFSILQMSCSIALYLVKLR